jgi:phosphoglucosamine mutase
MEAAGVEVEVSAVGDRYVLESLREKQWILGGEQSGHIISSDFAPTGDGIAAALMLLQALAGRDLAGSSVMEKLPQTLKNVTVSDREVVAGAERLWSAVEDANRDLEGKGRVLVRSSGTEPLVRVMVEAPSQDEAERICSGLVSVVEEELGG